MTADLTFGQLKLAVQIYHQLIAISFLLGGGTEDEFDDLQAAFLEWAGTQTQSPLECADHCLELVVDGRPLPFDTGEHPNT